MIIRMKHLDLVCVASEREATLERLRELGVVHLDLGVAQGAAVASAKGEIDGAERAVRLILKAREAHLRSMGTHGSVKSLEIRPKPISEVLALDADRATLVTERERLDREIKIYLPYGDFDPALATKLAERGIRLRLNKDGTFSVTSGQETDSPFSEVKFPEMRLSKMQEKLARVENRIGVDTAKLAMSDEKAILAKYPALRERMEFEQAKELMSEKGAVAVVSGWLPLSHVSSLASSARDNGWGILLRDPVAGEIPPTLVEPPKLFRPMKALFAGLGISPAYDEADVSVPFMCYFSLFFAMLVGDGAYGALFLIGTLLARRRLPKAWFVLLTVFSFATIGWGVLSNTWFGAGLPWCADWPTVTWLADPSYRNIMLVCFTIGVSHLMLARIWNGICKLPDTTALAEFGWAGVLLFMYFVTNSLVGIFASVPSFMLWVFGASLVLVFGFTVKISELKTRGIELGMLPLSIMSALGDIISYVRLFAVGLASVKVAENFNSMATGLLSGSNPLWLNAILSVAMVLILLAGHGLNLAMAGLSVLVHAVRLNTLEFSNHKGISWAGYAFNPFHRNKEVTK